MAPLGVEDLKECPFCGMQPNLKAPNHMSNSWRISCELPCMVHAGPFKGKDDAIEFWNKRFNREKFKLQEEGEELKDKVEKLEKQKSKLKGKLISLLNQARHTVHGLSEEEVVDQIEPVLEDIKEVE